MLPCLLTVGTIVIMAIEVFIVPKKIMAMRIMLTISAFLFEQLKCEQRGCCWSPLDERNVPWCFFPTNHGYTVESVEQPNPHGKSLFSLFSNLFSHSYAHPLRKNILMEIFVLFSLFSNS